MEEFIVGVALCIFVLFLVVALTAFGALCLMWAWNIVMPLFWHAAPHLSFVQAVGVTFLISAVRGIFTFNHTVNNKGKA